MLQFGPLEDQKASPSDNTTIIVTRENKQKHYAHHSQGPSCNENVLTTTTNQRQPVTTCKEKCHLK